MTVNMATLQVVGFSSVISLTPTELVSLFGLLVYKAARLKAVAEFQMMIETQHDLDSGSGEKMPARVESLRRRLHQDVVFSVFEE